MIHFIPNYIVCTDGTIVLFKFIESLRDVSNLRNEEATIEKLKDDKTIMICTVSGQRYNVSVRGQPSFKNKSTEDVDKLFKAICHKWHGLS
jgi:hypothetical protein